jgi:hypothetical protein
VTPETRWINDLSRAGTLLGEAVEDLDEPSLDDAIWDLSRVLGQELSSINGSLKAAADSLRLGGLIETLGGVSGYLAGVGIDPAKLGQFERGLAGLGRLHDSMTTLVADHDRWQAVDNELRPIQTPVGQDLPGFRRYWRMVKRCSEPLYTERDEDWANKLRNDAEKLDAALVAEEVMRVEMFFLRFRSHAALQFYEVDFELKRLCGELTRVGAPLDDLLEVLG